MTLLREAKYARATQENLHKEGSATLGMIRRQGIPELLRFCVVGGFSFACNFAVIVFLTEELGLNYLLSILVCFGITTLVSFWLNRRWTYRKNHGSATRDLRRYLTTTLVQMGFSLGLCSLCVEVFHWPYRLAVIFLSIMLVPVNYWLHRRWSFRLGWRPVR